MTDVDDAIARTVGAVRDDFGLTQRPRLPLLAAQLHRRARRRRIARAGSGAALAVGGAVALSLAPISLPFSGAPATEAPPVASGSGVPPGSGSIEGLGFWPHATEEESAGLCDSSLLDNHHAVASRFVGDVLGWTNAAERKIRRVDDDHIVKEQGNFPSTFAGGPLPAGTPWITLELSRIGEQRCWWVTGVSDAEDSGRLEVTVTDGDLEANWQMADGAERADLIVFDAGTGERRFIPADAGVTRANVSGFEGPGYAIVMWKGADGRVFSAAGVTLPEGDHSASSL